MASPWGEALPVRAVVRGVPHTVSKVVSAVLASPSGRLLAKRGGEEQKMSFGKKPAAIPRGELNQCFFIAKIVISIIIIGRAGIIACSVAAVNIIQSV